MSSFTWCSSVAAISFVTFEDGHVDVGANLWHVAEPPCGRLGSTALCWLQVITAVPAGDGRISGGRHQGHWVGEGQQEEDTQHDCASFVSLQPLQSAEETEGGGETDS